MTFWFWEYFCCGFFTVKPPYRHRPRGRRAGTAASSASGDRGAGFASIDDRRRMGFGVSRLCQPIEGRL
jgi:hypothetical protein